MQHDKLQPDNVGRPRRRRIAFAAVIVGALALTVGFLYPTSEEELAAIDAAPAA